MNTQNHCQQENKPPPNMYTYIRYDSSSHLTFADKKDKGTFILNKKDIKILII